MSCWDQEDQTSYTFRKMTASIRDELMGITDHFGGIDKAKAKKLGYEVLPGDAWIEQDVDILIPAAIENQITGENVQQDPSEGARSSPRAPTARRRPRPTRCSPSAASSTSPTSWPTPAA